MLGTVTGIRYEQHAIYIMFGNVLTLHSSLAPRAVYQLPHFVYFNSAEELLQLIHETDLDAVSERMRRHNVVLERESVAQWDRIFRQMFHGLRPATQESRPLAPLIGGHGTYARTYAEAVDEMYGLNAE